MLLEALKIARRQIADDRGILFESSVTRDDEGEASTVDSAEDRAAIGAYDQTLAFIDAAIAKAEQP